MVDIVREHLKHTGAQKLPTVYPLVFFTGDQPYNVSTDLFDLFEQKELGKEALNGPYQVIDITQLTDEQLKVYIWSGLMTRVMKHIRDDDIMGVIEEMMGHIRATS
jgi:hypothetical protein